MAGKIDTGGFVYPHVSEKNGKQDVEPGITLRDWLAGLAMQGLAITAKSSRESMHPTTALEVARSAYHLADIMLKIGREQSPSACSKAIINEIDSIP